VFRRFLNETQTHAAIFTIDPNGAGERQVTHPSRGVLHLRPDWSPDGRLIAYVRASEGRRAKIYRVRRNGTGRRLLSTSCTGPIGPENCLADDNPAWSPDGSRIAFTRVLGADQSMISEVDILIMTSNGNEVMHVADHKSSSPIYDWSAQWAPDGDHLVFHREDTQRGLSAIFTVHLDGTHERRLTPWRMDGGGEPDWSPDGRWIVFEGFSGDGGRANNVCLVHPKGKGRRCIASTDGGDFVWGSGSFSPDGRWIVAPGAPGVGRPGYYDVYVMDAGGSDPTNVTRSYAWDGTPDWGSQPDT
jgi:TolB protein